MADYTLRQLEYFVAVAESGSITGAAERVHLSQSAMSTALAELERALDVQLLLRHHARGVTLTAAGEQLLMASRRLLAQAGELSSEAHGLGHGLAGALSIGCFEVLAPYVRRHAARCRAGHRGGQPPHPPRRGGRRPEHRGTAAPRLQVVGLTVRRPRGGKRRG